MSQLDLADINAKLGHDAPGLVKWVLGLNQPAIVTTNFRPFEAVILHLVTRLQPDMPVVWMDNGYNTEATYRFADEVTKQLRLNLQISCRRHARTAKQSMAPRPRSMTAPCERGRVVEPFARALRETAHGVVRRTARHHRRARADGPKASTPTAHQGAPAALVVKDLHEYCVKHGLPSITWTRPGRRQPQCGLPSPLAPNEPTMNAASTPR
jgi:phosphoadenosine phosphosulfate reductase